MWVTPKTDWVASDYYNAEDLNRVENNSNAMSDLLSSYYGHSVTIVTETNRDEASIEFNDSLNRIESNIEYLASIFYYPEEWEQPKTNWNPYDKFDWKVARRLEVNLLLLYILMQKVLASQRYCGTFNCGQALGSL